MKRALAVGAGLLGGILLAGMMTAATVALLPVSYRSEALVWTVAAGCIAVAVWAAWSWSSPSRE
jgi:hypothetical protein